MFFALLIFLFTPQAHAVSFVSFPLTKLELASERASFRKEAKELRPQPTVQDWLKKTAAAPHPLNHSDLKELATALQLLGRRIAVEQTLILLNDALGENNKSVDSLAELNRLVPETALNADRVAPAIIGAGVKKLSPLQKWWRRKLINTQNDRDFTATVAPAFFTGFLVVDALRGASAHDMIANGCATCAFLGFRFLNTLLNDGNSARLLEQVFKDALPDDNSYLVLDGMIYEGFESSVKRFRFMTGDLADQLKGDKTDAAGERFYQNIRRLQYENRDQFIAGLAHRMRSLEQLVDCREILEK